MSDCLHPSHRIVDDYHEGISTCLDCSRVLDQLYLYEEAVERERASSTDVSAKDYAAIQDICSNHNIPSKIASICITVYKKLLLTIKAQKFPNISLIAFSIYRGLLEEDSYRTAQEIFCMTGVSLSQIFDVERFYSEHFNVIPASEDFVERFCVLCELEYQQIWYFKSQCETANVLCENFAPQTVAASVLFTHKGKNARLTAKFISDRCSVSMSSIYKCSNVYRRLLANK